MSVAPLLSRGLVHERYDPARVVGRMTVEQYFDFERRSAEKHEYVGGRTIRMAGGSPEHNLIAANVLRSLGNALESAGTDCDAFGSDQRVHIRDDVMVYPDVVVACADAQFDHRDALRNAVAVVEVMSPSTEKDDRTDKFRDYRSLESLEHYVLIDQSRIAVTHYAKVGDGLWVLLGDHGSLSDSLRLTLGGSPVTISLAAVYRRVFSMEEAAQDAAQ